MKLFLLWLAFSARSPNIDPNPFDYEISGGTEIKHEFIKANLKVIRERENGALYNGRVWNSDFKYLLVGEYVKDAKNISTQKGFLKYPFEFYGIKTETGAGAVANHFEDPKPAIYGKFSYDKFISVESSYWDKLHYFKGSLFYEIDLKGFYLKPTATYFHNGTKADYRAKIEIGKKWKKK